MTREECIENLKYQNEHFFGGQSEALKMAISALSVEPCEDCISREMAMKESYWIDSDAGRFKVIQYETLLGLPSVQPTEKGEWIERFDESGKWYECDQCHTDWGGAVNFCPNCGADMRGKSCSTCKNNDDEFSGECYECLKGIFDHYEPEEEKAESEE